LRVSSRLLADRSDPFFYGRDRLSIHVLTKENTMFKKITGPSLLSFSLLTLCLTGTASAEDAQKTEAEANAGQPITIQTTTPEISEQQFQLERQIMINDLSRKLIVLGAAHDCAEKAEDVAALRQCTDVLRTAILDQSAKKP
jgi:hypothetical protein